MQSWSASTLCIASPKNLVEVKATSALRIVCLTQPCAQSQSIWCSNVGENFINLIGIHQFIEHLDATVGAMSIIGSDFILIVYA